MSQFFYRRIVEDEKTKEKKVMIDSFNTDLIIRTVQHSDDLAVVYLHDGHEESRENAYKNAKGKIEIKRERDWYQSRIELEGPDIDRFRNEMGCPQRLLDDVFNEMIINNKEGEKEAVTMSEAFNEALREEASQK